jgi:hypothetical protein
MSSYQAQANLLLASMPTASQWRQVASDMNADYVFAGAIVYVVMQPLLKALFAVRTRYTGACPARQRGRERGSVRVLSVR